MRAAVITVFTQYLSFTTYDWKGSKEWYTLKDQQNTKTNDRKKKVQKA